MRWPRRLVPRTLAAQMGLLLVGTLLAAQALTALVFVQERGESFRSNFVRSSLIRVAGTARLIEDAPPDLARRVARGATGPGLRLRVSNAPPRPRDRDVRDADLTLALRQTLDRSATDVRALAVTRGERRGARITRPRRTGFRLGIRLRWQDGPPRPGARQIEMPVWLIADVSPPRPPPVGRTFLTGFLISAIALTLAGLLLARRLARPLRDLRRAAQRLGQGEALEPLALTGPSELRGLTSAFNEMQERLARLLADRTLTLAALGHDLRTPITSLRLRAEFIEDDDIRARMLETLAEMQTMTEETLAFARDDATAERRREVDLTALVESLIEDVRDAGHDATLAPGARMTATVRVGATHAPCAT